MIGPDRHLGLEHYSTLPLSAKVFIMNRQLFSLVIVLLLVTGAAIWLRDSGSSKVPSRPPKLVLVTGGSSKYWQMIANGARAAGNKLGADLTVLMPENDEDVDAQMKLLLNIDSKDVDGIAVSPLDAEQQTRLINRLSQNTYVVTFDSDAPLSTRMSYVGASNLAAGRKCAQLVKEALPEGGKVVVLLANLTKNNTLERKKAFEETLEKQAAGEGETPPSYEIVDSLVDEGDEALCRSQLVELLEENPDVVGVVGMNSYHGPLLVKTRKEFEPLQKMRLVTFDDEDETLQGIEDGAIYATVAQDPFHYGFEAVRLLASYYSQTGHLLPVPGSQSTVTINTQEVRKDNVQKYRQLLKQLSKVD